MSKALSLYQSRVTEWAREKISEAVLFQGSFFSADTESRALIAGWVAHLSCGGSLPSGFVWRSVENADVPMTDADVIGLNAALVTHANQVRLSAWQAKQDLESAADLDAAESILAALEVS